MPDIVVKKSKISGFGVFAARPFKKGEVVLGWNLSHQLSEAEARVLPEKLKHFLTFSGGKIILMQEPERFVNHSCEANTHAKNFADVASRDIQKGEEVTADYGEELLPWE